LFTGHGGDAWKATANQVGEELGLSTKSYLIGWGLDYYDGSRDWEKRREVADDDYVLVQPDRFIAWRAQKMVFGCCEEKLFEYELVEPNAPQYINKRSRM
jgi:hypothetical protein